MGKQTKVESSTPTEEVNLQTQAPVTRSLHDEVAAAATALNGLSLEIGRAVATLEAAAREVAGHQQAAGVHLHAYQANLLGGERAAADVALGEVAKCRDQAAKAASKVRNHAQSIEPLIARCSSVYDECIRLAPLTAAAILGAKRDDATMNAVLTGISGQGSKLRGDVAKILASLPRE